MREKVKQTDAERREEARARGGPTNFETVLEEWTMELTLRQQGTLLTCIRGVDDRWCPHLKQLNRWLRLLTMKNGNPSGSDDFSRVEYLPTMEAASGGEFRRELEYLTVHYYHHLILGIEVIAYKHPDQDIRDIATYYFHGFVGMLHQEPETEEHMDWRLADDFGKESRDPPPPEPDALKKVNGTYVGPPTTESWSRYA